MPEEYLPKTNNRFTVVFPNSFNIESWLVQSVTTPKYNVNFNWDDITIEFIEITQHSSTNALYKLVKLKQKQEDNFTFHIKYLTEEGVECGVWEINVNNIIDIKFGDELNYSNDEIIKNTLRLQILTCEYTNTYV